jgi:hypothetical protein
MMGTKERHFAPQVNMSLEELVSQGIIGPEGIAHLHRDLWGGILLSMRPRKGWDEMQLCIDVME